MEMNKYPCRIKKGCVWRIVDGETIILSDNANKLHTLSDVGGEIWRLADGMITIDGIISKIVDEFETLRTKKQNIALSSFNKKEKQQLSELLGRYVRQSLANEDEVDLICLQCNGQSSEDCVLGDHVEKCRFHFG